MTRADHPLIAINGLLVPGTDSSLTLRNRYAEVADKSQLDPILERSDCIEWLHPRD